MTTEKESASSVEQHFPLLRRPRPPPVAEPAKQTRFSSRTTSTNARRSESVDEAVLLSSPLAQERLRAVSTPVHPLPRHHPTPSTPHRHPLTSHSPTHHHSPSPILEDITEHGREEDTQYVTDTADPLCAVRGPPPFPVRKMKLLHRGKRRNSHKQKLQKSIVVQEQLVIQEQKVQDTKQQEAVPDDENEFTPLFIDLDEVQEAALYQPPVQAKLREKMISRQNYLKLTSWFTTHVPRQDTLNTAILTVDHSAPGARKPHHQILIELLAMVEGAIGETGVTTSGGERGKEQEELPRWPTPNPGDIVFQSSTSRYFCGEGRSNSPFDGGGQPLISPSQVAVLESMLDGGYRLSLKAHFLDSLPLLSPLSLTLTRLNLSFNTLRVFPDEIFELTRLKQLRMRNNPIQDLPNGIRRLEKLEDFCISFNLLTSLPSGLFELPLLRRLDISHNSIQYLSRDVSKLRTLQMLNVESNELIGLPHSLLSLPLTHLHTSGNYLHPVLWRESCRNPPQALVDMCCVVVSEALSREESPSSAVQNVLTRRIVPCAECDRCRGPVFGAPLKVVKSVSGKSNFTVPVLFTVCSQTCKTACKVSC